MSWGRSGWIFLHAVADSCPQVFDEVDSQNYANFFNSIASVLPCESCRTSFAQIVAAFPCQAKSRHELVQWLHHVHNLVNMELGKKMENNPEAWKLHTSASSSSSTSWPLIIIGVLIAFGILYLFLRVYCFGRSS